MSNTLEQEKRILAIEDAMLTVAQSHEFDKDDHPFKWLLLAPKRRNLRKLLNAELGTSNGCAAFLEAVKRLGVEATGRALRTFNGQNKGVPEFGKLAMESLELSQDFLNGLARDFDQQGYRSPSYFRINADRIHLRVLRERVWAKQIGNSFTEEMLPVLKRVGEFYQNVPEAAEDIAKRHPVTEEPLKLAIRTLAAYADYLGTLTPGGAQQAFLSEAHIRFGQDEYSYRSLKTGELWYDEALKDNLTKVYSTLAQSVEPTAMAVPFVERMMNTGMNQDTSYDVKKFAEPAAEAVMRTTKELLRKDETPIATKLGFVESARVIVSRVEYPSNENTSRRMRLLGALDNALKMAEAYGAIEGRLRASRAQLDKCPHQMAVLKDHLGNRDLGMIEKLSQVRRIVDQPESTFNEHLQKILANEEVGFMSSMTPAGGYVVPISPDELKGRTLAVE